jgi:replicative DNA helicase
MKMPAKPQNITPNLDFGKIPPQAVEFEEFVLGAMMLESRCIDNILAIVKPESFYKDEHQKIFTAILNLKAKSKPVDLMTVTNELRSMKVLDEVGGPVYVSGLTSKVAGSAHAEFHARIIQQCFIKRELIRYASEIQSLAFDESIDLDDLLNEASLELNRLSNETVVENAELLKDLLTSRLREIEAISAHPDKLIGVPSGLTKLDRMTGGWQKTDLIIIAARPSMGKTSLSFNQFAIDAASFGIPTAFFSLEMSKPQITDKSITSQANISPSSLRTGKLMDYEWELLDYKTKKLYDIPLFIDDTPALSLLQLRSKVTHLLRKNKLGLVIIDYLQLMNGKQKGINREQEVSGLTSGLKALAKETNVPIIALSQLSREVEKRGDKRPQLSDLRESGAIEQDADLVIFIHRPEKYGETEDYNGNSTAGLVELILAKHRNGPVGTINIYTNEYCSQFTDEKETEIQPLPAGLKVEPDKFYEPKSEPLEF